MIRFSSNKKLFFCEGSGQPTARKAGWAPWAAGGQVYPATRDPWKALAFREDLSASAAHMLKSRLHRIRRSYATTPSEGFKLETREGMAHYPFQLAGIEEGCIRLERSPGVLLADPMGLGKTNQAIGMANYMNYNQFIVICPASLRLNWAKEVDTWSTNPLIYPVPVLSSSQKIDRRETLVLSYEGAIAHFEQLDQGIYPLVIIDESSYCKDLEALRSMSVFRIMRRAKKVIALSGTPIPNTAGEIYGWAQRLAPEAFGTFGEREFIDRFAYRNENEFGGKSKGVRLGKELNSRLRGSCMIRRRTEDVLPDLPPKNSSIILLTGTIKSSVLATERGLVPENIIEGDTGFDGPMSTVRRVMSAAKAPLSAEYAKTLLRSGVDKLVIFAHFKDAADILEEKLQQYGLVRIKGGDGVAKTQDAVDRFQTQRGVRILLGANEAVKTGHTMTAACRCLLHDASWVPGDNDQLIGRLHRIGQENAVQADFLVIRNSLDYRVLSSSMRKDRVIRPAIN